MNMEEVAAAASLVLPQAPLWWGHQHSARLPRYDFVAGRISDALRSMESDRIERWVAVAQAETSSPGESV